ncbi:hypothetical protein LINGRAHAP2_LOCUS3975 [Linum grandiflorum]
MMRICVCVRLWMCLWGCVGRYVGVSPEILSNLKPWGSLNRSWRRILS